MDSTQTILDKINTLIQQSKQLQYRIRHRQAKLRKLELKQFTVKTKKFKTFLYKKYYIQTKINQLTIEIRILSDRLNFKHECRSHYLEQIQKEETAQNEIFV